MKFSPVTPCLTSNAITKLPLFINSVVSTYNKENFDLSRYTNFNFLHPPSEGYTCIYYHGVAGINFSCLAL